MHRADQCPSMVAHILQGPSHLLRLMQSRVKEGMSEDFAGTWRLTMVLRLTLARRSWVRGFSVNASSLRGKERTIRCSCCGRSVCSRAIAEAKYNGQGFLVSADVNTKGGWASIEATVDSGACATASGKSIASLAPIHDCDTAKDVCVANKPTTQHYGRRGILGGTRRRACSRLLPPR